MYLENVRNAVVGSTVTAGGDVLVNGQKITNYFYSASYQDLKKQRDESEEQFLKAQQRITKFPDEEEFKVDLLKADAKRQDIQKKLDDLKNEVIRLAETFTKIPVNTERLSLARQHFEAGDYPAARAILDAEQMGSELDALLRQKEQIQRQQAENEAHLTDKANEFLILARLTAIDFTLPGRFGKTVGYFEQSLKAAHTVENTFAYAYFLQENKQFKAAASWYEEALALYRSLAEAHPEAYLPNVAMTAANLSIFYWQFVPDKEQSLGYAEEALVSALPLAESLPVAQEYARVALQVAEAWDLNTEEFLNQAIGTLDKTIRSV